MARRISVAVTMCAVLVLVAAFPLVASDIHNVVKGPQGPNASAKTWEFAPATFGTWTGKVTNNGLRSLVVDVYDNTTGVPESIMHQKIRFAAYDAVPTGIVYTRNVTMSPVHNYMITVTPSGPRGSSCDVEDVFVSPTSKTTTIYDMFEQPWGDWYEWRYPAYRTDIVLSNMSGKNTLLYNPDQRGLQGIIYAPYRMNISITDCDALSVANPEFMPVMGPSIDGAEATLDIYFQYLDMNWWNNYWKPIWNMSDLVMQAQLSDGWYPGVIYSATMNRQAAEEWLGMPQTANPLTWWVSNGDSYIDDWLAWIGNEGNVRLDIWSGYEWPLTDMGTKMKLIVLPDGKIRLQIGSLMEGYEVLTTRWLRETGICSHEPFYEDMSVHVNYLRGRTDFWFDAVCQYSLHAVRANGTEMGSAWAWEPNAIDYVPSWYTPGGNRPSLFDPYANLTYTSWNAGDPMFGQEVGYDNTPTWFNLTADSRLIFKLPTSDDVIGYAGTGVGPRAIIDLIRYGDDSAYDNITIHGSMDPGFFLETADSAGQLGSSATYDPVNKILTIRGPADFDNVRHPNGALYHGAPWIEFNVTPALENLPPVASIIVDDTVGLTVYVDGRNSYDPDGSVELYSWTWGDGTSSEPSAQSAASHTYPYKTYWTIQLQVIDNLGALNTTSLRVLLNDPPVAVITVDQIVGTTVYVDGRLSYDPDGVISQYTWTWGDDSPSETSHVLSAATHTYATAGIYLITLYVEDNSLASDIAEELVTVSVPPGPGEWSTPVAIDSGMAPEISSGFAVASNSDGEAVAAWVEKNPDISSLSGMWANRFVPGGGWLGPELIASASLFTFAYTPCVGMDEDGNATVAWTDAAGIGTRMFSAHAGWGDTYLFQGVGMVNPSGLTMAIEVGGRGVMAWEAWDGTNWGIYAMTRGGADDLWSGPTLIESQSGQADNPSAAITVGGDAIVAFSIYHSMGSDIYVSYYDSMSNEWYPEELIEGLTGYSRGPRASMDDYRNGFVVWTQQFLVSGNDSAYGNVLRRGFGWGFATRLDSMSNAHPLRCEVSAYGNCNAVVAWSVLVGYTETQIRYCLYVNGSGWLSAGYVAVNCTNSYGISLAVDPTGSGFVAWSQSDGSGNATGYFIMAARYTNAYGWSAPEIIAGAVNTSGPEVVDRDPENPVVAWDDIGFTDHIWASRFGIGPPPPPVASFTYNVTGLTVNVDASGSIGEAGIVSYTWDWGDGSPLEVFTTPTASHTYSGALSVSMGTPASSDSHSRIPLEPDSIFGYTYLGPGTILPGCSVTVTNPRSGETMTTVSDEFGQYLVELYNDMPGDLIVVTAVKGNLSGTNSGILEFAGLWYLWLDIYLAGGHVHSITLTITDTLGRTSTMTQTVLLP